MSIQKQELIETIESLPEELAIKAMEYIEYIKFIYASSKAPEDLIIKDEKDLIEKLEKGIKSTEKGEVYSMEGVFEEGQRRLFKNF